MKTERWKLNLYTLWGTQVLSLLSFGLSVPFIPYYLQDMGITNPSQLNFYVGLASTLPAATMAVFAPVWGIVSDRHGRKLMIIRAMVAATIILCCMGLAKTVWMFLLLRALQGAFTGTITASMAFVSANTPENRMSFALGFMTSSNFLGYAVGPAIGGFLAEALGYSACFYTGAVTMALGCLCVVLMVKENPDTYGERLIARRKKAEKPPKLMSKFLLSALAILLIARITRSVFAPFVALYVQERIGSLAGAATYTGMINSATGIATAIAAVTLTRLGDKYSKMKLVFALTGASCVVGALLVPRYSLLIFTAVLALYFFIAGAIEPIITSAVSEETDPSLRGALFGMMGTVNSVGMMVAPMLGAAISAKFSVQAILVLLPLGGVAQLIMIYCNRRNFKSGDRNPETIEKTPLAEVFEN